MYTRPNVEPEATRLGKRKLANLHPHDTPDDGPPLMHMARPAWDSSDPLDLDALVSKRAAGSYLLETMHNRPAVEPEVVRPMKRRRFGGLHSHSGTRTSDGPPLMAHPVPELSGLPGPDIPACKRLISGSLSQQQIISLIKAIFTSKDEVAMIRDLRGDDAQTFVDVVNEVHFASSSFNFFCFFNFHLPLVRLWISRISIRCCEGDV